MTHNYPYLPEGKSIGYVPVDNQFMREAKRLRDEESTERNHPTGAVVVYGNEIIGRGMNRAPIKNKRLQDMHKNGLCIRRLLKVPSGQKYWLCPGCAKSKFHAETSATKNALKNKAEIKGADLYLYGHWWCCKPCWDSMIVAGIDKVYLVEGATELFKR